MRKAEARNQVNQATKAKEIRVGLYIRVSTEEQAQNLEGSIKSQEQRLRQHLEFKNMDGFGGRVTHVFIDSARSGKDMNRPELKRMLGLIEGRELDLVMVSELSRISRTIRDFAQIWDLMKDNKCYFLSLREQFDTTNAAGEMVLFTMANLAQFERKQVSERVSANFQARAERGLHNGGSIPYGYNTDPTRSGNFIIVDEEAEVIREAFRTYLSAGCLAKAGRSLNERGIKLKKLRIGGGNKFRHGTFSISNLHPILRNKDYVAIREYKDKNGNLCETKAVWTPIIDEVTFFAVQKLLSENKSYHKSSSPTRYPYLLSKLVVCATCGDKMCGKSAWGRNGKVGYYEHSWSVKRQAYLVKKVLHCEPQRIQAKVLEPLVWMDVVKLLSEPKYAEIIIKKAQAIHEKNSGAGDLIKLRQKIKDFGSQLEALAEHLSKIPKGVSPSVVFNQMKLIEDLRVKAEGEVRDLEVNGGENDPPVALTSYVAFIEALKTMLTHAAIDSDKKAQLLGLLIHKIDVHKDKIEIFYKVGLNTILDSSKLIKKKKGLPSGGPDSGSEEAENYFGSNTLTNGAP
jgi:site-specific DNA recombinase